VRLASGVHQASSSGTSLSHPGSADIRRHISWSDDHDIG
jgi:hypothetical protein